MDAYERCQRYLAKMDASVEGQGGDEALFKAAGVIVGGFGFHGADAMELMREYNLRSSPPWNETRLVYKIGQAEQTGPPAGKVLGYLLGEGNEKFAGKRGDGSSSSKKAEPRKEPKKPVFNPRMLARVAGQLGKEMSAYFLMARSPVDVRSIKRPEQFLSRLGYGDKEFVVVFTIFQSQGQFLWPRYPDPLPMTAPQGVWYLANPVDGEYHPNPRQRDPQRKPVMSRRSEESVVAWRFMVLESDEADMKLWSALLAQMPLRIAAIYTSGGKSLHALIRVDAESKRHWDEMRAKLLAGLVTVGADRAAMTAVRLTRLPGCVREEKKQMQKLLYLNDELNAHEAKPICERPPKWTGLEDAHLRERRKKQRTVRR